METYDLLVILITFRDYLIDRL